MTQPAEQTRIFRRNDGYQWVVHKDGTITWHWNGKSGLCVFGIEALIKDDLIHECDATGEPLVKARETT